MQIGIAAQLYQGLTSVTRKSESAQSTQARGDDAQNSARLSVEYQNRQSSRTRSVQKLQLDDGVRGRKNDRQDRFERSAESPRDRFQTRGRLVNQNKEVSVSKTRFELELTTREGDTVNISFKSRTREVSKQREVLSINNDNVRLKQEQVEKVNQRSALDIEITGDISEEELSQIETLIQFAQEGVDGLVGSASFNESGVLGLASELDAIGDFSLNLTQQTRFEARSYQRASGVFERLQALPAPGAQLAIELKSFAEVQLNQAREVFSVPESQQFVRALVDQAVEAGSQQLGLLDVLNGGLLERS